MKRVQIALVLLLGWPTSLLAQQPVRILDDTSAVSATLAAHLAAIETSVQLLDNAVSGASLVVTNAGTFATQANTELGAAITAGDAIDNFDAPTVLAGNLVWNASAAKWQRGTTITDPCNGTAKTFFVINISTPTTVEMANAVASQFFHICSIDLHTNAANNVVIAEDDTDGCGSITAGVTGGTTAATGYYFAANGGRTLGNGSGTVAKTTTANRYLCILTSATTQLSGTIGFVSAP